VVVTVVPRKKEWGYSAEQINYGFLVKYGINVIELICCSIIKMI
jgi:hypothetical protein